MDIRNIEEFVQISDGFRLLLFSDFYGIKNTEIFRKIKDKYSDSYFISCDELIETISGSIISKNILYERITEEVFPDKFRKIVIYNFDALTSVFGQKYAGDIISKMISDGYTILLLGTDLPECEGFFIERVVLHHTKIKIYTENENGNIELLFKA